MTFRGKGHATIPSCMYPTVEECPGGPRFACIFLDCSPILHIPSSPPPIFSFLSYIPISTYYRLPFFRLVTIIPIEAKTQSAHNEGKGSMSSYLSRLSPVPGFPAYTGPHKVGTLDVELPISELESPTSAPVDDIATVQYRIFYPCEPDAKAKSIGWLPSPQRGYVSAYTRFLGAGSYLAEFISYVFHCLGCHVVWNKIETYTERISSVDSSLDSSTTSRYPSSKMLHCSLQRHRITAGRS